MLSIDSYYSYSLLDAIDLKNLPAYLELTDDIVKDIMKQSHIKPELAKVCAPSCVKVCAHGHYIRLEKYWESY